MKDNFSLGSAQYARYRPGYPPDFFDYLYSITEHKGNAWDCGTGNGQVAFQLAAEFEAVYATDISRSQIGNAAVAPNVFYSVQPAEHTEFQEHFFDLIVVAQAIHWFDFDRFYAEVRRTIRPGGLLCILGYGRLKVAPEIDALTDDFYTHIVGPYWDPERRYIDEGYKTIPFPFNDEPAPAFVNQLRWTPEQLLGYLGTWSATKHYIAAKEHDPVKDLAPKIARFWPDNQVRPVRFPLLLRITRL